MINFILYIVSSIFVSIVTPIGYVAILIKAIFTKDKDYLSKKLLKLAVSKDQFGNVVLEPLLSITLTKSISTALFGNEDETISSVLGKNKLDKTLTLFGKLIVKILNFFERNHSVKSIEEDE